jgi:hypothetical protein
MRPTFRFMLALELMLEREPKSIARSSVVNEICRWPLRPASKSPSLSAPSLPNHCVVGSLQRPAVSRLEFLRA